MHWFKLYNGFSTDTKIALISHQTKICRAIVNAIIIDLLEYASSQKPRGTIKNYSQEISAFNLGIEESDIAKVYNALLERNFIESGKIVNWDKYQDVDRTGAERQKRFRANKSVTDSNSDVTDITDVTALLPLCNTEEKRREEKRIDKKEEKTYKKEFLDFWEKYPKQRKDSKEKSYPAWNKAITKSTMEEIQNGLEAYIGSSEVSGGFAKGTIAWLNAERWKVQYTTSATASKPLTATEKDKLARKGAVTL